ncbi:regulatory protein uhpc [Nannochloropsis oceanica]
MSAIEKLSEGRHARRRIFGPLGGPPAASTPLVVTGLFQGYLAYNMARKALAVAAPGLQGDEGLSKTDLGVVSSSFTVTYGASKFAGSVITDHVSCRALFSLGLVLTGVLCLIFSLSSELPRLCLLWSLHGVVQGAGWPSLAKICVERVAPRAQGRVWALLSAAGNAGHVCAGPLLLSLGGGWRRVMQGAGILALLSGGLAWMLTGGDDDAADEKDGWFLKARKEGEEGREILLPWSTNQDWRAAVAKGVEWIFVVKRILRPEVAALFLADSLIYFVIKGLADWSVLVLTETKGLTEKEAVGVFFYCELGAILGSFASGWVSDQVGGLRTSTSSVFSLLALPFLYATHKMPLPGLPPLAFAYFVLGVFVNGPKTLSGIALRQLVPPRWPALPWVSRASSGKWGPPGPVLLSVLSRSIGDGLPFDTFGQPPSSPRPVSSPSQGCLSRPAALPSDTAETKGH